MDSSTEDLAQELFQRSQLKGWSAGIDLCRAQAHIVQRYDLQMEMDNFQKACLTFPDLNGRSVGMYSVNTVDGYARSETAKSTEVLVLVEEGMILGWVSEGQVLDIGQPWFSLNVKALNPMPKVFDFAQPCPHLAVHGGWWVSEDKAWECFGCGRYINDYATSSRF